MEEKAKIISRIKAKEELLRVLNKSGFGCVQDKIAQLNKEIEELEKQLSE